MNAIKRLIAMCRQKEEYLFRSEMDKVHAAAAELAAQTAVIEAAREFHLAVCETGGHLHSGVSKYSARFAAALAALDKVTK